MKFSLASLATKQKFNPVGGTLLPFFMWGDHLHRHHQHFYLKGSRQTTNRKACACDRSTLKFKASEINYSENKPS